jgi:hypothetical protein
MERTSFKLKSSNVREAPRTARDRDDRLACVLPLWMAAAAALERAGVTSDKEA